ncbi:GA module-containing protein [Enterococcus faecalis]
MRTKLSKLVTSGMVGASLFGTGLTFLSSLQVNAEEINVPAATTEYVNGEAFVTPYYKITPSYPKKAASNTEVPVYYNVEFLKQTELYAVQVLANITNGKFQSTAPKATSLTDSRVNFLDTDRTKQYKVMVKTGSPGRLEIKGKFSAVGDDMKEPQMDYRFSIEIKEQTTDELTEYKEAAKQEINKLPNLTDEEKADFTKQVDEAKNIPVVNNIVEEAKNKDKENEAAALAKAKEAAKQEINKLPNLTDEEKADFTKQVDEAKNIPVVNNIVEEAKNKDKENEAAALAKAKEVAKQEINKLPNLTEEEKADFTKQVEAAKDIPTVNKIVEDAKNMAEMHETSGSTQTSKEEVKPVSSTTDSTNGKYTQQNEVNKEKGSMKMRNSSITANSKDSLPSTGEENNNIYKIIGVVSMFVVLGAYFYKKILKGTLK